MSGIDADIVVVGAGTLGLSTALHAARARRSVVVVEQETAGSQASGRAAGLFKSVQADELRTRLARRSIELAVSFGDWAGADGSVDLPVVRSGSFLIARTDAHKAYLRAEERQSRTWGVDVREASAGQLADRLSYYRGDGSEFALWCPEDIYIDEPTSLVRALVAACSSRGVQVLEREQVIAVTTDSGRVAGVETAQRAISAPVVVDAAGAWTRQVAALAGSDVAVATVRHQLLVTEPTTEVDPADPIARVIDAAIYLRPNRGGLMAGAFEPEPLAVDPRTSGPDFRTDAVPLDVDSLRKITAQIDDEVPLARAGRVGELRGGLFTMSPDGRFVAGPLPDVAGLWVAAGCNGSGFSSALGLGEALAAWITGSSRNGRNGSRGGNGGNGGEAHGIEALSPARFGPLTDEALVEAGIWQYAHYYDPAA